MEAKQKQDLFVQDPIEDIIKITGGLGRWQLLIIFLTTWSCVIAGNYRFCGLILCLFLGFLIIFLLISKFHTDFVLISY